MCTKPSLTVRVLSPEGTIAAIQILAGVFQAENQAPQNITVCSTGVNIFDKSSQNLPQAVKFNCPFGVIIREYNLSLFGTTENLPAIEQSGDAWAASEICV